MSTDSTSRESLAASRALDVRARNASLTADACWSRLDERPDLATTGPTFDQALESTALAVDGMSRQELLDVIAILSARLQVWERRLEPTRDARFALWQIARTIDAWTESDGGRRAEAVARTAG